MQIRQLYIHNNNEKCKNHFEVPLLSWLFDNSSIVHQTMRVHCIIWLWLFSFAANCYVCFLIYSFIHSFLFIFTFSFSFLYHFNFHFPLLHENISSASIYICMTITSLCNAWQRRRQRQRHEYTYLCIFIGRKSVFVISYYHNNYFVNFFHKN